MNIAPFALTAIALFSPTEDDKTPPPPKARVEVDDDSVIASITRGVDYLLANQNADGSWGGVKNATFTSAFGNPATYHCWTVGTTGLSTISVLELGRDANSLKAAERGVEYLILNAKLVRPADWDVDNVWGLIYGLTAISRALQHPHFAEHAMTARMREAAATYVEGMAKYQSPKGGWGYYANPNAGWRPEWATSFTTASGLIALVEARAAGITVDDKVFNGAVKAIEACRLPTGAYTYNIEPRPSRGSLMLESIDNVRGSLGRIQVCNYALTRAGAKLPEGALTKGLDLFFEHHKFLDVARNKPIPHEAYYANAAYFYLFGHYYASRVLELLPPEERARYRDRLRTEIMKCQQSDGATWDFWIANCTKPYGTSFSVLGLSHTLEPAK